MKSLFTLKRKLTSSAGNLMLRTVLTGLLTISLLGCAPEICNYPSWPIAGPNVAAELEAHCFPIVDGTRAVNCPATAKWLAGLDKLKDQIARPASPTTPTSPSTAAR